MVQFPSGDSWSAEFDSKHYLRRELKGRWETDLGAHPLEDRKECDTMEFLSRPKDTTAQKNHHHLVVRPTNQGIAPSRLCAPVFRLLIFLLALTPFGWTQSSSITDDNQSGDIAVSAPLSPGASLSLQELGFDVKPVAAAATMKPWLSAYADTGVYLGGCNGPRVTPTSPGVSGGADPCGINRPSCAPQKVNGITVCYFSQCTPSGANKCWKYYNNNLSEQNMGDILDDGWGVIPIWVGLQAPCGNSNYYLLSSADGDPTTAGQNEAKMAGKRAVALGLTGIVYYDMEYYSGDKNCSSEVQQFLKGWIEGLHNLTPAFLAGIYVNVANINDFTALNPAPDTTWVASWDHNEKERFDKDNPNWIHQFCSDFSKGNSHNCTTNAIDPTTGEGVNEDWVNGYVVKAGAGGETLTVSLVSSPGNGIAPLATKLTASVGGTAEGTINYSFWWNCSDTDTSISNVEASCGAESATCSSNNIGLKCDGQTPASYTLNHVYSSSGKFIAKVIVERGSAPPAQAQATITVSPQTSKPSAYVYVTRPTHIDGFVASTSGQLTAVSGSPWKYGISSMAANKKYLFGTDDNNIDVDTFSIGANGSLTEISQSNGAQYDPNGCVTFAPIQIDRTGATIYNQVEDCNPAMFSESFTIQANGALKYLGSATDPDSFAAFSVGPLGLLGGNDYAYYAGCFSFDHEYGLSDFAVFQRESSGALTYLSRVVNDPTPEDPNSSFCPTATAPDLSKHLAVAFLEEDDSGDFSGNAALATYTADSAGNPTTTDTWKTMPVTGFQRISAMSISPSGKFLAVGGGGGSWGSGFQIFDFNGSKPITPNSGLLQASYTFVQFGWDTNDNLYALSTDGVFVYSVTSTGITEVGSLYSIPEASSIAVIPQ